MVKENLLKLGFTETETEIYMALYKSQRLTPLELSIKTGIKRPTVYAAASELVRLGLIEEQNKKKKYFVLLSPEKLQELIQTQKRELEKKSLLARTTIDELSKIPRSRFVETPSIKIVEAEDIEEYLYSRSPVWVKNSKQNARGSWYGFQNKAFMEEPKYTSWIKWFWKQGFDVDVKMLTNYSDNYKEVRDKLTPRGKIKNTHGIKYRQDLSFTATQWVIGDYIINLVEKGHESYLIETQDKTMAENLRKLFVLIFDETK